MQLANLQFDISTVGDEITLRVGLLGAFAAVRSTVTASELRQLADWINTMADKNTRKEAG